MHGNNKAIGQRVASNYASFITRLAATVLLLAVAMFAAGILFPGKALAQADAAPPAPSSLIVKLVSGLTIDEQAAVIARNGGVEKSTVPALRLHIVEVGADQIDQTLAKYQSDSQVARVEVNAVRQSNTAPTDPLYPQQWSLPKIGWDTAFGSANPNASVVVAVLDTGIDASHPDLFGNVIAGTSVLDGSNGMTDPSGHGTMVAGTVAARTNTTPAEGIAGVAYAGVRLMPVTVLNADGLGQDSDIINGVIWAVDHGADVILMAFSNPGFSASLQEAIDYAWSSNVVLVAANGNDGIDAPTFPAGDRGVIGVSATDENDQRAAFSNYGTSVFLAAPGTNIVTTDVGGEYITISGTSSAAAIVAGAAAQMMAVTPTLSNGVIVGRLARTADPAGTQQETGNGRVNLARALLDTGTDFIQPAGAAPVGTGGPFVGPYRAATTQLKGISVGQQSPNPVQLGASATYSVLISFNGNGSCTVALSASGLPAGASAAFNPPQVTGTGTSQQSSVLTIATSTTMAVSTMQFTVTATGTGGTGNNCSVGESQQATATLAISKGTTDLAVAGAAGIYGGTVNLFATLTSSASPASGKSIAFTLNGSPVGNATTNASGVATLSNVSLAGINAATYNAAIGASFSGDSGLQPSSGTAALTVALAQSSTTVTCPSSVMYSGGAQIPCTASVTGAALSQTLTVSYSNNVNAGAANASATYAGDTNHTGSSDSKSFTINQASSTTTVTCPASVTYNGSAQTPCTATLTGAGGLSQALAVTYSNNANAGTATANASFTGDTNHTGSSNSATFTIDKANSSTSITSSKNPATADENVTFSATVTSGAAGNVQFVVDNTNYGAPVPLASGVATIAFTDKTVGTHTVSATYLGDANYNGSSGNLSPNQAVTAGAPAMLAFNTQPADTQAGQAITPAVTVRVLDAEGNLVTTDSSSVTIAISAGGVLQAASTTTVAAIGGMATFSNIKPTKAGTFTLHATDGTLTAADSSSFNVSPGAAVTFAFDVPASIAAGESFDVTIYATDTFDNIATGYTGVVHFTSTDPHATLPPDAQFVAADGGVKTLPLATILKTAGNRTITATDTRPSGITGTSPSITVDPGNATVLVVTAPAAIETAGVPFNVTVEARDAYGNTATGYAGKVHFDISDPKAGTLSDYTFVAATDEGLHAFMVTLHSAGQWTVKATDTTGGFYGESGTITVQPGPPAKLTFKSQPGNTFVGVAIPDFAVEVHDADDNVVDNANGGVPITIAIGTNPTGLAVLSGTSTVNAVNGVATVSGLMLNKAATGYTLTASSDPLASATSSTFDVGKGAATLSLGNLNQTYDGLPKSATVTTTPAGLNGVSVTYDGSTTVPTNAGSYAAIASLDNDDYQATNATGTLVVAKANATIVVTPYSVTYDGSAHTATGTATGVKNEALSGLVLTGTTHTKAGDYPADGWTFTDTTGNYNNASGTVHDVITKANATIVVTPYNVTYDGNAHMAAGTATGVKNEALSGLVLTGTTHTNAGDYQNDGWTFTDTTGNYNDASGTVHDVITKANATIVVTPYSVTYDGNAHTATGTAAGVKNEALTGLVLAGTTHTDASDYPADGWTFTDSTGNYNNASGIVHDVITKANATINVTPYSVTYDGSAHTATGTATGVKNESLSGLVLTGTTHTNAGDYPADAWTFTDATGNYNSATGSTHDSITKANATIVVMPYSVTYDGSAHTATGTATGVKNESLSGLVLTGTTHTNAGDYPADAWTFTDAAGNYNSVTGSTHDSIAKANATINVTPYSVTYDGNAHIATGSAVGVKGESLSGLNLAGTAHTNAADYAADVWTFTDVGGNYNNASGLAHDIIDRAPSMVNVTGGAFTYDAVPHPASAIVSGVGAGITQTVSWTYSPPGDATVPINAGAYLATAAYAGDVNHLPNAGSASITIVPAPSTTTVSVVNAFFDNSPHGGAASVTGVGGLNQALAVTYAGTSGTTYGPSTTPPSSIGVYQASASYAGDANHVASGDIKSFNIVGINITGPGGPIAKGNPASVTMTLVGAASSYPVTCKIDWNDGTSDTVSGSGTCTGTHTYAAAGVYEPKVTVTSAALVGTAIGTFQYIVIYDAGAGFVTGGGWINSPAGASTQYPDAIGKANFGFNSKYQKGADVPSGDTQFQFQAGNLNFKSKVYQWLVISGARAQYKGSGTINGVGDYGFILTAIDGSMNGGGGTDRFRIKIWDNDNNGAIVYDNQISTDDTATLTSPSTALGGGSIVIHK